MKNDMLILSQGMETLRKELGLVESERFINLIRQEPFDYTKWQQTLWADKSVDDIFLAAKKYSENNNAQ